MGDRGLGGRGLKKVAKSKDQNQALPLFADISSHLADVSVRTAGRSPKQRDLLWYKPKLWNSSKGDRVP